jgi:hypothetical protein
MTLELELDNQTIVLKKIVVPAKVCDIKDQATLLRLIRKELAFNPTEGYAQATPAGLNFLNAGKTETLWEHKVSHGGKGEPYEYLTFNSIPSEYTKILAECRSAGFGKECSQPDGFTYKVISGGLMRRLIKKE